MGVVEPALGDALSYATPKRAYPGSRRNGTWAGRTTTIQVGDELWKVPRGFGKDYLDEETNR